MTNNYAIKFEGRVPGGLDKFPEGWRFYSAKLSRLSKIDLQFLVRDNWARLAFLFSNVGFVFLESRDFFCAVGVEDIFQQFVN